jgi:WD40 repeat protein
MSRLSIQSSRSAHSNASSSNSRRNWDDPPEEGPVAPLDSNITMVLQPKSCLRTTQGLLGGDIQHVEFSPTGNYIIATTRHTDEDKMWYSVTTWDAKTHGPLFFPSSHQIVVHGQPCLSPAPDNAIACAVEPWMLVGMSKGWSKKPIVEFADFAKQRKRDRKDMPLRSPLAWSPSGKLLAGASSTVPSRIYVFNVATGLLVGSIPHHTDDLTHLAFTPDGTSIVSLSKDGSGIITSLASGRVVRKFEVGGRHNPSLLRVSPDGQTVASVWGSDVMVWSPFTGQMTTWNLSAVRESHGVALAISPDCRFLACRSEDGFDVADLLTGKFRGEVAMQASFVTTVAFSFDGKKLVTGKHNGEVMLYDLMTVDDK